MKARWAGIEGRSEANTRLYAFCGVIAPIFFGIMVFMEQSIVPGYDWVTQHVSDLGLSSLYGSYAILQDANFVIFGVLIVAFAFGRLRDSQVGSRGVTLSLTLTGTGSVLAGVFQGDPNSSTLIAHGIASLLLFVSLTLCQFLVFARTRQLKSEERGSWGRLGIYSLASGVVTLVLFPQPSDYPSILGVVQRVSIAVPWLWLEVIALSLFRLKET